MTDTAFGGAWQITNDLLVTMAEDPVAVSSRAMPVARLLAAASRGPAERSAS